MVANLDKTGFSCKGDLGFIEMARFSWEVGLCRMRGSCRMRISVGLRMEFILNVRSFGLVNVEALPDDGVLQHNNINLTQNFGKCIQTFIISLTGKMMNPSLGWEVVWIFARCEAWIMVYSVHRTILLAHCLPRNRKPS